MPGVAPGLPCGVSVGGTVFSFFPSSSSSFFLFSWSSCPSFLYFFLPYLLFLLPSLNCFCLLAIFFVFLFLLLAFAVLSFFSFFPVLFCWLELCFYSRLPCHFIFFAIVVFRSAQPPCHPQSGCIGTANSCRKVRMCAMHCAYCKVLAMVCRCP